MDAENKEMNQYSSRKRKTFYIFALIFIVFIGLVIYEAFFSARAIENREDQEKLRVFTESIEAYEEAMRNDVYGGKTPEETLNLFIKALEENNFELASRYFVFEDNKNSNQEILNTLIDIEESKKLTTLINNIKKAIPDEESSSPTSAWFSVFDHNSSEIIQEIHLEFNKFSGIWKIETM